MPDIVARLAKCLLVFARLFLSPKVIFILAAFDLVLIGAIFMLPNIDHVSPISPPTQSLPAVGPSTEVHALNRLRLLTVRAKTLAYLPLYSTTSRLACHDAYLSQPNLSPGAYLCIPSALQKSYFDAVGLDDLRAQPRLITNASLRLGTKYYYGSKRLCLQHTPQIRQFTSDRPKNFHCAPAPITFSWKVIRMFTAEENPASPEPPYEWLFFGEN